MRKIGAVGIVATVVLVVSALFAGGASAEEFTTSVVGAKFTGKALNTQVFTAKSGGAKIECAGNKFAGTTKALKSVEEEISFVLESCKVFGLGTATITLLDTTLLTSSSIMGGPGLSLLALVTITVTTFPKCKMVLPSGQSFKNAGEIAYSNKTSSTIEVKENIKGIASEVTESESTSLCGTVGEKNTTGTFTGNSEIGEEGGAIQIK